MKRQHSFWLKDFDWDRLQNIISDYFTGKGRLERFMEKICNENIIFIKGSGKFKISSVG